MCRFAPGWAGAVLWVLAASCGLGAQAKTSTPPAKPAAPAPTAAASAPASANANTRFSFYGLAPASAGLAQAQAERALGQPFKPEAAAPGRAASAPARAASAPARAASAAVGACQYQGVDSHPGVRFTLASGVVSRAETRDARYATLSGVHVGDTLDRARQAYGKRLSVGPHPYFDRGHTLTVYSPDRRFALVMESNDSGRIITLRGGRLPDVGWLEGCS